MELFCSQKEQNFNVAIYFICIKLKFETVT
jgi:hypothetical protein